jgi:hypothetical protein
MHFGFDFRPHIAETVRFVGQCDRGPHFRGAGALIDFAFVQIPVDGAVHHHGGGNSEFGESDA